jgi:diguanylate cyclase (GGDEF)-like protein
VFAVARVTAPTLAAIPVLVVALGAQFAVDFAVSSLRVCVGLGMPFRDFGRALLFTFVCDLTLAPVGYAAARAFPGSIAALLILLPPILLLAILQADRRAEIDRRVALAAAYTDTQLLARRDPLTGIANRLAFEEALAHIRDTDDAVGVVLADADGLKTANDERGHHVGDALLVAIAGVVDAVAVAHDAEAFRIGGDEFVLLLPGGDGTATATLGRALRTAIASTPPVGPGVIVSASVGHGSAPRGIEIGAALAAADAAAGVEKVARGVQRR